MKVSIVPTGLSEQAEECARVRRLHGGAGHGGSDGELGWNTPMILHSEGGAEKKLTTDGK